MIKFLRAFNKDGFYLIQMVRLRKAVPPGLDSENFTVVLPYGRPSGTLED